MFETFCVVFVTLLIARWAWRRGTQLVRWASQPLRMLARMIRARIYARTYVRQKLKAIAASQNLREHH